jgi:error-prone DNA polymerase
VPLFQEQAMKIAIVGAGFSPGRADELRRAMATFRNTGEIWKFRQEFLSGMAEKGYDPAFAERCFRQLEGFGTYGFPESHAASFASLVYVSAWIKKYHPAVFAAALLNSQPMGFYAPAQIVRDAKDHQVEVRPIDVAWSDWDCTLEKTEQPEGAARLALRLGLRLVSGLKRDDGVAIVEARLADPFRDVGDLASRARLDRGAMDALARADALRSLVECRRHGMWETAGVEAALPLAAARDDAAPALPPETAGEQTVLDYAATGLSLRRHPLALLRSRLRDLGGLDTRALNAARQGRWIKVPGLVLVRQRPGSAKGVVFFTIEDEWGTANLVLYPDIVARDRAAVVGARLVLAEGRVERTETKEVPIIHLVVRRLHNWSRLLDDLHTLEDGNWARVLANADEVRSPNLHDPRDPDIRAGKRGASAMPPSRDFR